MEQKRYCKECGKEIDLSKRHHSSKTCCIECSNKNKEKNQKEWIESEKAKSRRKKWYYENKARVKEYNKRYKEKNKNKLKDIQESKKIDFFRQYIIKEIEKFYINEKFTIKLKNVIEDAIEITKRCISLNLFTGHKFEDVIHCIIIVSSQVNDFPINSNDYRIFSNYVFNKIKITIKNEILPELKLIIKKRNPLYFIERYCLELNISKENIKKIKEDFKKNYFYRYGSMLGLIAVCIYQNIIKIDETITQRKITDIMNLSLSTFKNTKNTLRRYT